MPKNKYRDCLAIVKMPRAFFEGFINFGIPLTTAIHGVRNIKILNAIYDKEEDVMVFLISSHDIPAYVGTMKTLERLITCEIVDPISNEIYDLPQLQLVFESCLISPSKENAEGE